MLKHYDKEVTQIRKMAGVKGFQHCSSTLKEKVMSVKWAERIRLLLLNLFFLDAL